MDDPTVAIVGGGPAGLMAAEALRSQGLCTAVYDQMPTVGRKFLMAGRGGLNLTHSEPLDRFVERYGPARPRLEPLLRDFGPADLREWALGLGVETFVGTSGRVFPAEMKAAPLLRRWVNRLRRQGVLFQNPYRLVGWNGALELEFETPQGRRSVAPRAVVLATGGASWMRLGSDGAWVRLLTARGVGVAPLRPANCGFEVPWSAHFRQRFSGAPVKSVAAGLPDGPLRKGEFVVTGSGVEGSLIYAFSAALRDALEQSGQAQLVLDLVPERDLERLARDLARPRGARSLAEHLRRRAGLEGVKAGLLRELASPEELTDPARLAARIKSLSLRPVATRPLDEALSTAGGVLLEDLDERLMLRAFPGVFCAGEMLDWEAPTGGYLLTACLSTGRAAGLGAAGWLTGERALTNP